MRVPESWLRRFASPEWTSEQIADRLTMAGLEVEEAGAAAPPFHGVVVAQVLEVARHPDADKLSVCEVDVGAAGRRRIVCGAPNVAAGMKVPCALPGAVLPGGLAIRPVKMRGVESQGMLCSARELGLSEDHSGLMVLAEDTPLGGDLRAVLELDETVFTFKLTPNLAHCMSVFGVARELAAVSGAPLHEPVFEAAPVSIDDRLPVTVEAPDLCGRFSGRVIRGVDPDAPTPEWMKRRLERAGQRSISALVDISNYVMLEFGRPTHVFDLDRIEGGLHVRWARQGERLALLNGQTVELAPDVGIIADAHRVESLAGIMGGERTAVSGATRNVYVEAAFWWPAAVAGRSRRYNFATDAGARFERGVDGHTTARHLEYLTRLILEVCGGQAGPLDDTVTGLPAREPVRLRTARARKVIGVEIPDAEIAAIFERLRLPAQPCEGGYAVTPPSYRFDLQIEEDLIEEVARIWGYERLPLRPPRTRAAMRPVPEGRRSVAALKARVAARDYQEAIHYSFVEGALERRLGEREPIRLLNPIAAQMDVMRTTLWGGMIETLRANLNRKAARVRLFEVGRVFLADASVQAGPQQVHGVAQPQRLGLLAYGTQLDEQWGAAARRVDFFDVKRDLETLAGAPLAVEPASHPALHPGRSARILLGGVPAGWIGELHPAVQQALELPQPPILAEVDLASLLERAVAAYREISKFPPVIRDLALVVAHERPAAQVLAEIAAAVAAEPAAGVVKNVELFDEYRGKGLENKEKSLAFRLWMQDTRRTLSEAEAAEAVEAIVGRLARTIGARLR
ncbi:MAG: phenylalanine--tRNA ligase subunit beta [Burkholderiales bacterium]|nr:phenylalanine--tRNA ligase subunit beta [Burkholderiales bacterium]OJX05906.1 MAG: phenylalanine--tRNA ligase subunit beta [Burkholderiales bacterium 70-64]